MKIFLLKIINYLQLILKYIQDYRCFLRILCKVMKTKNEQVFKYKRYKLKYKRNRLLLVMCIQRNVFLQYKFKIINF